MLSRIKGHCIAAYGDMCTHCMHRETSDSSTWVPRGRLISSLLKTGVLMLRWPIHACGCVHRTAGGVVHFTLAYRPKLPTQEEGMVTLNVFLVVHSARGYTTFKI